MLQESSQESVPFGQQLLPAPAQVQGPGRIGQDGQRSGFRPGKLCGRAAKIAPGSRFQPYHVTTVGGVGGIEGQNLFLGIAKLQAGGLHCLNGLLPQRALLLPRQADDLHGKGGAPAHHVPGPEVGHGRPHQRYGIHARMPAEGPVFKLDQGRGIALWHAITGREPPLLVGRNARPQQFALRALHYRGIAHVPEQLPRQAAQPGKHQGREDPEDARSEPGMTGTHWMTLAVPAAVAAWTAGSYMASTVVAGSAKRPS